MTTTAIELMAIPSRPPPCVIDRIRDVLLLRTVSTQARILLCLLTVAWALELLHQWVTP